jgi:hypothetical protein
MMKRVCTAVALSALCFAQSDHSALIKKFVGTWNENQAKRKGGPPVSLRFQKAAGGMLEELRGPEVRPLVQPVKFGTSPYGIDNSENTIAWKQIDANHFQRQLFESGKLLTTRDLSISKDGKTLTEVTQQDAPDSKTSTATMIFRRSSGDAQGLVGVWKLESMRTSDPNQLTIEPVGTDGLRIKNRIGVTRTLTFDGKDNPASGPAVISGTTSSAKMVGANSIEETAKREGVLFSKITLVLSNDGKTLTSTARAEGPTAGREPFLTVYEKK